jgi:hypothetical protein
MRVMLGTGPLLLVGFALIGCGKDPGGQADPGSLPQATTDSASPTVVLKIPSMH